MSDVQVKRALISVFDKAGLVEFAKGLAELGIEIISTGGTFRTLKEAGVAVIAVDQVTGFPEMMDGRVKTLHPKVHGGILANRDIPAHMQAIASQQIETIDLVCVNLYPFVQVTSDPKCTFEHAIENIDIGGPTMVRSAAKNHKDVAIVTNPSQYAEVLAELKSSGRRVSPMTRRVLAQAAFRMTAEYDTFIQEYLLGQLPKSDEAFPKKVLAAWTKTSEMRYGENPHQKAALYVDPKPVAGGWGDITKLSGKELSFNNLVDANAAMELCMEFSEPAAVVIKHTNPCGAALDKDIVEAYRRAYLGDVNAAMGGIIAVNRPVDEKLAEAIMFSLQNWGKDAGAAAFFAEIVVAPEFSAKALEVMTTAKPWGKEVRLLAVKGWSGQPLPAIDESTMGGWDMKRLRGAMLVQTRDNEGVVPASWKVMTKCQPTAQQLKDLQFAWLVCKHTKSNAIVLAKDGTLAGTGAGQMSRVMSTKVSAELAGSRASGCVLASDAFFPFRDSIDQAASVGVKAIVEPGGSKRDDEVVAAADELGIPLIFTGTRHFRH